MDAAYYWCYFFLKSSGWEGLAISQSFLASGTAPVSIRGFQVLLTAISHGLLVSTSLFWLYLAVGGDFSLVIEGHCRRAALKKGLLC